MKTRPPLSHFEQLPLREELEVLARHYHHLQNEHKRSAPGSGVRRRIEDRLLETRERFERLLAEWVPDAELQQEWREYLHHRTPEPQGPPAIRPLVFLGRSEQMTVVAIRRKRGDELEVEVDGALVERISWDETFAATEPFRLRLDRVDFDEIFSASPEARQALSGFLADGGWPPWEHAAELLRDGLIDAHVALTPRGHRALAGWRI